MLTKSARLTNSADFARTTKSGHRVTTPFFVGYLYLTGLDNPAKCGLIINKTIGGSVVRHKLARKIRHALSAQLTNLPTGSLLVIRAVGRAEKAQCQLEVEQLVNKILNKVENLAKK